MTRTWWQILTLMGLVLVTCVRGQAAHADEPAPAHGGTVFHQGDYYFEVVHDEPGEVRVYPYDADGRAIDASLPGERDYVSGTMRLRRGGLTVNYNLMPASDGSLKATYDASEYPQGAPAPELVIGSLPGQRYGDYVRFQASGASGAAPRPEPGERIVRRARSAYGPIAGFDDIMVVRNGDDWLVRAVREGRTFEVPMRDVPEGATPSIRTTEHGYVIVEMTRGDQRQGYWIRANVEEHQFQYYDGRENGHQELGGQPYTPPRVLTDGPGLRETIGSDGAHYTQITRGDYRYTFRHEPGSGEVTMVVSHSGAGQDTGRLTLPLAEGREFEPRIASSADGRVFISLDDSAVRDVLVVSQTRSGRDSMPYYDNGRIVLRPGSWSYEQVVIVGNGMGTWTGQWHTGPNDPNFIRPPHWRPFSNGTVTGWLSRDTHTFIPMSVYTTNVNGARVAEALFEQTAISGIYMIPVAGNLVMIGEALAGEQIITGRQMSDDERVIHGVLGGLFLIVEGGAVVGEVRACRPVAGATRSLGVVGEVVDDAVRLERQQVAIAMRTGMSEPEAHALVRALGELDAGDLQFLRQVRQELGAGRSLSAEQSRRVEQILTQLDGRARSLSQGAEAATSAARTGGSEVAEEVGRNSFRMDPKKFDYFYGRVSAPDEALRATDPRRFAKLQHNYDRSQQMLRILTDGGMPDTEVGRGALLDLFERAAQAPEIARHAGDYGITITRAIEEGGVRYEVKFFYDGGDLTSTPRVVTMIPKVLR